MEWKDMTSEERVVAEQAVLTLRALMDGAARAPMGQGMSVLEGIIHNQGREHLLKMMSLAAASPSEAQKKGSASSPAPAEKIASSRA